MGWVALQAARSSSRDELGRYRRGNSRLKAAAHLSPSTPHAATASSGVGLALPVSTHEGDFLKRASGTLG